MNSLDEMQMSLQCDEQFVSNGDNFNSNSEDETILRKKKPIFCRHKKWTKEEDNKLRQLVNKFGDKNWRILANSMENRNPRQCRERWNYYLNPNLKVGDWTPEEDNLILQKKKELGRKWTLIATFFENRTDAMIKTRYNALLRNKNLSFSDNVNISKSGVNLSKKEVEDSNSEGSLQADDMNPDYFKFLSNECNSEDDYFFNIENEDFRFFVC